MPTHTVPTARAAAILHGRPLALRRDLLGASLSSMASAMEAAPQLGGVRARVAQPKGRGSQPVAGRLPVSGDPRPYGAFAEGVAIIGVDGPLLDRALVYYGWGDEVYLAIDGYDRIGAAIQAALDDSAVSAILLRISSPGGLVSGCFELCDRIAAIEDKPVVAHLSDYAYSAGYAVASSCPGGIIVAASGAAGSIGSLIAHESYARYLDDLGIDTTFIESHALKSSGDPAKPLEDEAAAMMQAQVDEAARQFVDHVAAYRSLTPASIDALQAGWFTAPQSLAHGLVDGIGSFDDTLSAMQAGGGLLDFNVFLPDPTSLPAPGPAPKQEQSMKKLQAGKAPQARGRTPTPNAVRPQAQSDTSSDEDNEDDKEEGAEAAREDGDEGEEGGTETEAERIAASPFAQSHPKQAMAAIRSKMTLTQFEAQCKASGAQPSNKLDTRMKGDRRLGADAPAQAEAKIPVAADVYRSRAQTAGAARQRRGI